MQFNVPSYSQYLDVKNRAWRRRSCGIVALKMMMDYYEPRRAAARSLPRLIAKGVRMKAYIKNVGWSHRDLARIAAGYGFRSKNYDWFKESPRKAFHKLRRHLVQGPLMASIFQNLKPNAHGHLVVVTGLARGIVFYHDPDSHTRRRIPRHASAAKFLKGWKRRIIVVRPRLQRKK